MKKFTLIIACVLSVYYADAQQVSIEKFDKVKKLLSSKNDTTYVLNFWATWCVPCVKEFPAFQGFAAEHAEQKVKVVMVSLDFKKDFENFKKFVANHQIRADVMLLDEPDYNSWINKVDSTWGGELPATIIINGSKHVHAFFPHEFTPDLLNQTFTKTIKQAK